MATLTGQFSVAHAALDFVVLFAGGIVVGFIWILRRLHHSNLEIAASIVVAWASFLGR